MLFNWKGCSLSLFVLSAKDVGFNTLNVTFQVFFSLFSTILDNTFQARISPLLRSQRLATHGIHICLKTHIK